MCFVGRLAKETTAEDLKDFLAAGGIADAQCFKLQPKDGKNYSTAAFKVSCSVEFKDNMFSENGRGLVQHVARMGSVCTLFGSITRTSTFRNQAQKLLYEKGA